MNPFQPSKRRLGKGASSDSRPADGRYDAVPREECDYPASPSEVIDLATGPFLRRFPELNVNPDK